MEDTELARRLLGRIIGEEIVDLVVRPQEYSAPSEKHGVTIYRLDFKATIKLKSKPQKKGKEKKNWKPEYKTVLIELQKAKHRDDLMRFRRYLGDNYRKKDEVTGADGKMTAVELPIITVYFLGFPMPPIETSVLKINRVYTDLITNKVLDVQTEFIEKLTHDCFVILIPELPPKERSGLEKVLKVFNQTYSLSSDNKLLEISNEELTGDDLLELLADRLRKAATDEDILRGIEIEEEVEDTIDQFIRDNEELKEENTELKKRLEELEKQVKNKR